MKTETASKNSPVNKTVPSTKKTIIPLKDLSEKSIVIKLSIGTFNTTKRDKEVSDEIAKDKGAEKNRSSFYKKRLKSPEMDKVLSVAAELRQFFRRKTLVWSRDGEGLVPIKNYLKIKTELEEIARKFYDARDAAVEKYEDMIKKDKITLGALYNDNDYPSKESFKESFYVKISALPIQKNDFRCNALSDAEVDRINEEVEKQINIAQVEAQRQSLNRVHEALSNLYNNLSKDGGRFHASNFTKLVEEINDVDSLNFAESEEITNVLVNILKKVGSFDADMVRESKSKRNEAIDATKAALDNINETMKAFM